MIDTERLRQLTEMASQIGEAMGILAANPSVIHLQRPGFVLQYSRDAMSTPQNLPFSNQIPGLHDAMRNLIDQYYQRAMRSVGDEIAELCRPKSSSAELCQTTPDDDYP